MPRNGRRYVLLCVVCAICAPGAASAGRQAEAQAPATELSFEVAAIRPAIVDASHPFNPRNFGPRIKPSGASFGYMTPVGLMAYAYGVGTYRVVAPQWAKEDHFDIDAKYPQGAGARDARKMLQSLLKERFQLTFHTEQRELEGYVLVVSKHGAKLKPSAPDAASADAGAPSRADDKGAGEDAGKSKVTSHPDGSSTLDLGKDGTQTVRMELERHAIHYELSKVTMDSLASRLTMCLGGEMQKVVDETGIQGTYQLAFDCAMNTPRPQMGSAAGQASDPQDASALYQSLEALGLKLEKRKFPQDVYVIDHIGQPSEN